MEFEVTVPYNPKDLCLEKLTIKEQYIIDYFEKRKGQWVCMFCFEEYLKKLNIKLGQHAKDIQVLKSKGYVFEKSQKYYCSTCKILTSHYKYLGFSNENNERLGISPKERQKIVKLLSPIDAFTGQKVTTFEVDHKTPHTVQKEYTAVSDMDSDEIKEKFQITSPYMNKLKDKACSCCKQTGRRTPFFMGGQIAYYDGDSEYKGSCYGCGWYDACAWRKASLDGKLKRDDVIFELAKKSKNKMDSLLVLEKWKFFLNEFPGLNLKKQIEYESQGELF